MALSSKDFWRLLLESRLRTKAECQRLYQRFASAGGTAAGAATAGSTAAGAGGKDAGTDAKRERRGDVVELARWLVGQRAISRYQAKVLLSGRAGPFFYGNYVVRDRVSEGRLRGCFRSVHTPTRHPVLLWFFRSSVAKDAELYALAVEHLTAARQTVDSCLSRTYEVVDLGRYKFVVVEDLQASPTGVGSYNAPTGGGSDKTGSSPTGVGSYSGSAEEVLAADGRFRAVDACRVMRHVAMGAAALHRRGLVHGDIRPENVWIDPQGNGRLLQTPLSRGPHLMTGFWKARLETGKGASEAVRPPVEPVAEDGKRDGYDLPPSVDGGDGDERDGDGAPERYADYAAPELAFVGQPVDVLTDVYAIGCTLYELLGGRPPFAGGGIAEKMQRHATEAIEPLEPLGVPRDLAKVVAFAMAKDRRLRYQSAADLAEALAYFLPDEQKSVVPQPATDAERRNAFEATQAASGGAERLHGMPFMPGLPGEDTPAQLAYVATMQESVSPTIVVRERRVRSRNKGVFLLALILALVIGGGVGYFMSDRGGSLAEHEEDAESPGSDGDSTDDERVDAKRGADSRDAEATADEDGRPALWVSPTSGEPISWEYLPPQAEILLSVRPREFLAHPEGERLMAAMGPRGAQLRAAAEEAIGIPLAEVEQLNVAWSHNDGHWSVTHVVRPAESTVESLESSWRGFARSTQGDATYFVSDERAYFAPADEHGKLFIVATAARMPELIAAGKESTPLWREMLRLSASSDADRLCTLLFTKNSLVAEAQSAFAENGLSQLHNGVAGLFPEDYRGAAISLHLDEDFYLESRLVANPQTSNARELADAVRERIERLPLDIEEHISRTGLDPYGARILIRLGAMARYVEQQLRVGVESDQVLVNGYLPAIAAHNLALGTELALVQPHRADVAEASDLAAVNGPAKSLAERLRTPITVVQTGDTLERALETIAAEIGVPIEILGGDFVSEGITRNNRFDLDIHATPAEEALRAVLLKANPEGKLVYVAKPAAGGEGTLVVTTRPAAEKRGDALPAIFGGP